MRRKTSKTGKAKGMPKVAGETKAGIIKSFSKTICRNLGHYVYRLVDPRNDETFYVGKGQGNRLFQHARGARKSTRDEDEFDLKSDIIRDIQEAGLSVIPIIHRHGLDNDTALEVEAALIDAYPDLANVQAGRGSSARGCKTVGQVKTLYDASVANFKNIRAVIIKIRQEFIDARGSVYNAVRYAWRINMERARGLPVVASVGGIIQDVFTDVEWRASAKYPGRYEFTAKKSLLPEHTALVGCRLPERFCKKGDANPIRYT